MEKRLYAFGITEYEFVADYDSHSTTARIRQNDEEPGVDRNVISDLLCAQANLTFRDPDGSVILDGSDIKSAKCTDQQKDENAAVPFVEIELTDSGKQKFAEATEKLIGRQIGVYKDDRLLTAPVVQVPITDGNVYISGIESVEEATILANQINSGALPFSMKVKSSRTVDPH